MLLLSTNFHVQLFSLVLNSISVITHLALTGDVIFLYLYNAGIDRSLISPEITLHIFWVYWMEKLFTTNVSSALKTQSALLQLTVFITFLRVHVFFYKLITGIKSFQIEETKSQMMFSLRHHTFPD